MTPHCEDDRSILDAEMADLRAMKARLDERRDSLSLDAHLHARLLRILDEIAGDS